MAAARGRVHNLGSQLIETASGRMEYARLGQGSPVLVVHGIFGGFDQGLVLAHGNLDAEFQAIVPSRFGYLGTPMPPCPSVEAQADAYASLLDALGIQRAAVIAVSAGSTSAIQFALRHPERCSALVLISPNAPGQVDVALPPRQVAETMFRSDFAFWALTTCFRPAMGSTMGVPHGFLVTPQYEAEIQRTMETILPVSARTAGTLFDMFVSNPAINQGYPMNEMRVPTLVVSALDDPLALHENARSLAVQISSARLLAIDDGGHMLLGHGQEVRAAVIDFLKQHAITAEGGAVLP